MVEVEVVGDGASLMEEEEDRDDIDEEEDEEDDEDGHGVEVLEDGREVGFRKNCSTQLFNQRA